MLKDCLDWISDGDLMLPSKVCVRYIMKGVNESSYARSWSRGEMKKRVCCSNNVAVLYKSFRAKYCDRFTSSTRLGLHG